MLDDSGERSSAEPDEFDPDSLGPDTPDAATVEPDSLGPDTPKAPEPPEPSADPSDADPEVRGLFWVMVVIANVALLSMSLGVMFVAFQGRWPLGIQLAFVGAVLSLYVYYRVRKFQSE